MNGKRITALVLVLLILGSTAAGGEEPFYTERKKNEAWLWEELSEHSPSEAVTAGVLSYFWRESQYRSDSVSGWATVLNEQGRDLCGEILRKTDRGLEDGSSRKWFVTTVRSCGGYGLGQWHSITYLRDLYDFAQDYGTSIGDARMQCAFVFHSLEQNKKLWKKLKRCTDPERAGRLIAIYYDGTQDGAEYMGYKAGRLWEKYGGEE